MDFVAQDNPDTSSSSGFPSERAATGVEGLDEILGGGFPRRRMYLIQGEPGTGKTTLSLQFLLEGASGGERCLYISLSESRDEISQVAESHGWNLSALDIVEMSDDPRTQTLSAEEQNTIFLSSEIELSVITTRILDEIDKTNPQRVVFDSLSEWRLLSGGGLQFRRQILALKNKLAARGATVLLLDDHSAGNERDLQSVAHGVLQLSHLQPEYGGARRRLCVIKMRGIQFRAGFHDFSIEVGGIAVFPRLVATDRTTSFAMESVSSGIIELDELLGGGLVRGTATLLVGASGTGKSLLSQRYGEQLLKQGEKVAIFAFEETSGLLEARSAQLGMALASYQRSGALAWQTVDSAELSPGEFAWRVRDRVEQEGATMVILDSLNGYLYSMSQDRQLMMHMHELLSYLNARGVISILIVCQNGMVGNPMQTPVDMSYLADTVVLLRHFEAFGQVRQAISVMKKRSGPHERTIREMQFTDQGIRIGQPLSDFKGVLTGVPDYVGSDGPLFNSDETS